MKIDNLKIVNEENLNEVLYHSPTIDKETSSHEMTGYASIDRPWLKYYNQDLSSLDIPNISIYQLAIESNVDKMTDIAIDMRVSKNNFRRSIAKISYNDFFEKIIMSAKASKTLGMKIGEIVPLILPNVPEARILIYSNNILGSISYPISPMMSSSQLEQLIVDNEIKNLFIFEGFYEKFKGALSNSSLDNIVLLDGSESLSKYIRKMKLIKDTFSKQRRDLFRSEKRIMPWNEYISYTDGKEIEPYYEDDKVAAIIGTSGTTGMPKGVCLTDRNINAAALSYKNGEFFKDKHFIDALLPSIGYGISMLHYQTVASKYVYLIPELLLEKYPNCLEVIGEEVTKKGCRLNFAGGPVHAINLKSSDVFKNGEMPEIENLVSGGASLSLDVESELNGIPEDYSEGGIPNDDIIIRQGYGLSEDTAVGTYSKRGTYKFGSIGIPAAYLTVAIFEPDTDKELPYGQEGEICITGPCVMKEYLDNPNETAKVIKVHSDKQRWIHTKDIGYMDEDGNVFHVERIKNIFMRNGFNVHPSKIAEFINTISFVKNSVVIGFDHPKEQCVPVAFVEIDKRKTSNMTDDEVEYLLSELCYQNLEETSIPYSFVLVDMLPINIGGKVDLIRIKKESEIDFSLENRKIKKKIIFNK